MIEVIILYNKGIFCIIVGEVMRDFFIEFVVDFCFLFKRGVMVRVVRVFLLVVIRLLILVDMVDVYLLLKFFRMVCFDIKIFKLMLYYVLMYFVL